MAIDPRNKKNIDDVKVYIEDTLISVAGRIGEIFKEAVEESLDGADAKVIDTIGKSTERAFRNAAKMSDDLAANSAKIAAGTLSSKDISRQQLKLDIEKEKIARKLQHANLYANELGEERVKQLEAEAASAEESIKMQEKLLAGDKARLETIEKNMGSMGELFTRLSKNKFFGSLINAEEGLIAMRAEAAKGTKGFALMGKGISAAIKGITKATVILYAIDLAAKALKFLVDLFIQADEQTTSIARNLGISKESAREIRREFTLLKATTGDTRNSIGALTKALTGVKSEFGAVFNISNEIGDSITFFTERLGISEDSAAKVSLLFNSFGQSATKARYEINEFVKEFAKANAFAVPLDIVIKDIAEAGEGMAMSYGFSAKALGDASLQARKFGLSLAATKSITEGLLDFESSLNGEIKLGLYLGRRVNFAKARALKLAGKDAEAAAETFKQLQGITKEQMRSPILQKFITEATGLSADQQARALLLTEETNEALAYQLSEYERIRKSKGKEAADAFAKERNLSKMRMAEINEINERVSASEKFREAMTSLKDTLSTLVNEGFIDKLILAMDVFANAALRFAGYSKKEILEMKMESARKNSGIESEAYKQATAEYEEHMKIATARANAAAQIPSGAYSTGYVPYRKTEQTVEDFVIRTHPKDTLVMAGGTKLGADSKKTNELLERLVVAVEKGGTVYLDGRKVGEALTLNTINLA